MHIIYTQKEKSILVRKAAEHRKTEQISIRLTPTEKEKMYAFIKEQKISNINQWILDTLNDAVDVGNVKRSLFDG